MRRTTKKQVFDDGYRAGYDTGKNVGIGQGAAEERKRLALEKETARFLASTELMKQVAAFQESITRLVMSINNNL